MKNSGLNIAKALTAGVLCLCMSFGVPVSQVLAAAKDEGVTQWLFDPGNPAVTGWLDAWGKVPAGATAEVQDKKLVITGTLPNQSYGCIYRTFEVDLDKTPYLEIDVESVSHHWYLLLVGDKLADGFIKIQPDTDMTGPVLYDLRLVTGLTGKQIFKQLQFGVSTSGGSNTNKGEKIVVKSIRVGSASGGGDSLQLYGPLTGSVSGWKNLNDDRSPTGVDITANKGSVTLTGNRTDRSYGMMYRDINVDMTKYGVLKVDVAEVTHHWFVIIIHPKLNKGFVRVQPDSNVTGPFYYDLKDIAGMEGVQNIRMQIGVSTNEEAPTALGETVSFKEISFMTPSQVPPNTKVLKKNDLKFQQKIQPAPPRFVKEWSRPSSLEAKESEGPFSKPEPARASSDAAALLTAIAQDHQKAFKAEHFGDPKGDPAKDVSFSEQGKELLVQNGFYKIAFSRENGAIASIQIEGSTLPAILPSQDQCLWRAETLDRESIQSGDFKKGDPDKTFSYKWDDASKRLKMEYTCNSPAMTATVNFYFSKTNAISIGAEIQNRSDKILMSLALPNNLTFSADAVERAVIPQLTGVAIKPGFFRSKKSFSINYPSAFSDFFWLGTRLGNLAVYLAQPDGTFQPASQDFSADGNGAASFTHKYPTCIKQGETWKGHPVRIVTGRSVYQSVQDYARDNGIDRYPSLESKMTPETFDKYVNSVFIKVDQSANTDFNTVSQFMEELPRTSVFHIAAFWPGGFDQYYPDYLPPDPQYGTLQDFQALIAKARARGMLAVPYTNPTWWNEGPTLAALSVNDIGLKAMDGVLRVEKYNGNPGNVVLPRHPKVIERNWQTVREFTREVPMDFLFEDQIGARNWIYQANSSEPVAYVQGLIEQVQRESKKIPLMTEGGFDKILPYETGFFGMAALSFPGFKEYDEAWGKGNWEFEPISVALAHSQVNFYQHNLSADVLSDSDSKITWNLSHGFGLSMARSFIRQNIERPWIRICDVLQKNIVRRMLGREMKGFLYLRKNVTWSRFGDVDIWANYSREEPLPVGDYTVAPEGFLACTQSGETVAGLFTRMNGADLEGRHYFVLKFSPDMIEVIQPDPKSTYVTLKRPQGWKSDSSIRAFRVEKDQEIEVPISVAASQLTFMFKAVRGSDIYRVRYARAGDGVEVSLKSSEEAVGLPKKLFAEVSIDNKGREPISNVRVTFSAWKISSRNELPDDSSEPSGSSVRKQVSGVSPGESVSSRFQYELSPSDFFDGRCVWVSVRIEYNTGKARTVKNLSRKISFIE